MNFLPKILLLGLISSSGLGIVSPVSAETPPKIEPKALAILKQMSDRLSAARSLAFTATITYESPSRIGPPLVYTTIADVTLERPNKLRVISPGDGQANQFYYDGKTITAYLPTENLVAVTKAPNNLDAALKLAYDAAAIYFPLYRYHRCRSLPRYRPRFDLCLLDRTIASGGRNHHQDDSDR